MKQTTTKKTTGIILALSLIANVYLALQVSSYYPSPLDPEQNPPQRIIKVSAIATSLVADIYGFVDNKQVCNVVAKDFTYKSNNGQSLFPGTFKCDDVK